MLETDPQLAEWQLQKLVSKGIVLVIAELGGAPFDLNHWRVYTSNFKVLATRMTEAEMREIDVRQKAKEDEAYFVRTYSERVISLLAKRGISMADLLEKPEAPAGIEVDIEPPVTMPDNAKNTGLRIKTLRESMRMSRSRRATCHANGVTARR